MLPPQSLPTDSGVGWQEQEVIEGRAGSSDRSSQSSLPQVEPPGAFCCPLPRMGREMGSQHPALMANSWHRPASKPREESQAVFGSGCRGQPGRDTVPILCCCYGLSAYLLEGFH